MKGTPVRYKAVDHCDEVRRRVFCRNYSGCLDHAIKMGWPGFSCEDCGVFEHEKLAGDELSDDFARCMALAFAAGALEIAPGATV